MSLAVEAEGLKKKFGDHQALRGVDLEVPTGTVLGVLGPNGAGKTTTVRILTTLLEPDEGRARVAGYDVALQAHQVRSRIGLAGQSTAVDARLTGRENLRLVGRLYRLGRRESCARAEELLTQFDLLDAADRPTGTYSGGMRRRLDLAASLMVRPPVLFLDEPTTGLDITSRLLLWGMVREQVAAGTTVLLTTQYLEEADHLADRIVIIDSGQVIAEGTPEELKRKVGRDRLEVVVADPGRVMEARSALVRAGGDEPVTGADGRTVLVTLPDGVAAIGEAAAALAEADMELTSFVVRQPSLDDVFLALTGAQVTTDGSAA
ncbi:ATP-binding cassette domain-containing protein [Streptomyces sp. H10-C2]|uniref:ATP-binding cassette domain-containing protein n=1 Tax=unclassified Streptomyces TaxID=2593676 RepID=UPI0024B962B3|nr:MULTISPECIES: ATP-binding cassette domain-containing protein [unclassified Streptomyces]MDJ0346927.1 ATP-binding cassette domain-containing protein [Streptomyces sp. PH10-H1]MDJ0374329.1 ATP-binding cassette domain-containing protein [Streptomyces sp. H10-C2]